MHRRNGVAVWAGVAAGMAIVMAVSAGLAALLLAGGAGESGLSAVNWRRLGRIAGFTLWQAGLSTLLSVGLAVPVARMMARRLASARTGWIRRLCLLLFGLPLVMPPLVGVLAVIGAFGKTGLVANWSAGLGVAMPPLYGLGGILLAHLLFNLPLAVRMLLPAWAETPADQWRLAAHLGFGDWACWRFVEWPRLRTRLPGVAAIVFLLCFASFTIVLALGGGPAATTLEVAIYESLRLDFDPAQAARFALGQSIGCLLLWALVMRAVRALGAQQTDAGGGTFVLSADAIRPDRHQATAWLLDGLSALIVLGLVVLPLLALFLNGLTAPWGRLLADPVLHEAILGSLTLAMLATPVTVGLALSLALAMRARPQLAPLLEAAGLTSLLLPPLAVGTGWFILALDFGLIDQLVRPLVIAMIVIMALPYAVRAIAPAVLAAAQRHDRLCASLGLTGWARFRIVDWPWLRQPVGLAAGLAAALAIGDLGAVALFGGGTVPTLPLLVYDRMGSYRVTEGEALALVLLALAVAVFGLLERGLGRNGLGQKE